MDLNNTCPSECPQNVNIPDKLVLALQSNGQIKRTSLLFSDVKSVSGKVDFVYKLLETQKLFPIFLKDAKSCTKSVEFRKKGNKYYSLKQDEEALEMYTYSIAAAEKESEDLGLSYANRSAVLFKLNFFEECLQDIQRAFQNNYPEQLKNKLIERQKNAENLRNKQVKLLYHQPISVINEENQNPLIECATNSVEIVSDPVLGRHIVAAKDIEIGEVFAVEPATFTLLTDNRWCHCHNCLTLCYNLIPCESCTQALFCSSECKNQAKNYHDFECPILRTVYSLDYNSCRILPLRIAILMKNSYNTLKDDVFKPEEVYKSGRYKEIHNLVTNYNSRTPSNLFERVTCVALFYNLVKTFTDFFKNCDKECEDSFKELVLHHLLTMACNFHGIENVERNPAGVYETYTIGAGAYSFMSLFNHSCAPNVERRSFGTSIVLSAAESIKKGDQIFENYGFHYATHTKTERQEALKKQYFFDCACRACDNDWGTLSSLSHLAGNSVHPLMALYFQKLADADLKTAEEIEPKLKMELKKLEKYLPSDDYCQVQELYKQCRCIFGNIRRKLTTN